MAHFPHHPEQPLLPFPVNEQHACLVCGHGSWNGRGSCENPGCNANPDVSQRVLERLAQEEAQRQVEATRRSERQRLRGAGFTPAF